MEFKVTKAGGEGNLPMMDVQGEIDVYSSPKLKEKIMEFFEEGTSTFAVNLTNVSYIDSTGLGVLIGGLRRAREKDGQVYLVFSAQRLKRIFEITGLDKNFTIVEKVENLPKPQKP